MITLELFGNPVPQQRPRFARKGKYVQCYDPLAKAKEAFQWQLRSQFREEPLVIPVGLDLIFYLPIPSSSSSLKKRQMANGLIAHQKQPDLDNLQKFVLDCMNKIIFKDDSQVCEIKCKKIYGTKPGTLIRIFPLADEKKEMLYENISREN